MKNNLFITSLRLYVMMIFALLPFAITLAQNDSVLNRSVTVERDFQPVIQPAGKVSTRPAVMQTDIEPAPVEYSDYTPDITPGTSVNPLLSQPTRFEPARRYNGYIRGAIGHPNTDFGFGYRLDDGNKSVLNVFAHHRAQWGLAALSKTRLGFTFTHNFSSSDLYFGLNGGNVYYRKYGHFYDYSLPDAVSSWEKNSTLYPLYHTPGADNPAHSTSLWTAEVFVGIKANAKQDFQYRLQTGYNLFAKPGAVAEHQIRTHADFDWHADEHHVGAKIYVQNNFLHLSGLADAIPDSLYNGRHNFRIEPYYAYEGKRVRLHLGVNLDLNLGFDRNSLSGVDNLTFAPSPHVNFEAQIAKQWLTLYADVTGLNGYGNLQSYMESNRYRLIHAGIVDRHAAAYTPVDGELGFHIRPYRDLLLELHGGYALMYNQYSLVANTAGNTWSGTLPAAVLLMPGDFTYTYDNYGQGKVGGQLNYHKQDIVRLNLYADYYFWSKEVYDRPNWDAGLRIDGRIDRHWSLWSDNRFSGSRRALAWDGTTYTEHTLRPVVELDLGVQYDMWVGKAAAALGKADNPLRPEPKPNLSLFFTLNNWLHRKNDIYYGYRSQGINFLLGATFRF